MAVVKPGPYLAKGMLKRRVGSSHPTRRRPVASASSLSSEARRVAGQHRPVRENRAGRLNDILRAIKSDKTSSQVLPSLDPGRPVRRARVKRPALSVSSSSHLRDTLAKHLPVRLSPLHGFTRSNPSRAALAERSKRLRTLDPPPLRQPAGGLRTTIDNPPLRRRVFPLLRQGIGHRVLCEGSRSPPFVADNVCPADEGHFDERGPPASGSSSSVASSSTVSEHTGHDSHQPASTLNDPERLQALLPDGAFDIYGAGLRKHRPRLVPTGQLEVHNLPLQLADEDLRKSIEAVLHFAWSSDSDTLLSISHLLGFTLKSINLRSGRQTSRVQSVNMKDRFHLIWEEVHNDRSAAIRDGRAVGALVLRWPANCHSGAVIDYVCANKSRGGAGWPMVCAAEEICRQNGMNTLYSAADLSQDGRGSLWHDAFGRGISALEAHERWRFVPSTPSEWKAAGLELYDEKKCRVRYMKKPLHSL